MLIIIALLVSLSVVFIFLSWVLHPEQRQKQAWRRRKRLQLQRHKSHTAAKATTPSPGYAGLWHQLLTRVDFDISTAERLTLQARQTYPGKTDQWYIQKVIADLDRNKRSRQE